MICCSSIGGFSSPPTNDLLAFRVEGSVAFEDLDLRLHLTPMSFVFIKVLRSEYEKDEDKEEMRETRRRKQFLSFYTVGNYSFPSKRSHSKLKNFLKWLTCVSRGESQNL